VSRQGSLTGEPLTGSGMVVSDGRMGFKEGNKRRLRGRRLFSSCAVFDSLAACGSLGSTQADFDRHRFSQPSEVPCLVCRRHSPKAFSAEVILCHVAGKNRIILSGVIRRGRRGLFPTNLLRFWKSTPACSASRVLGRGGALASAGVAACTAAAGEDARGAGAGSNPSI